MAAERTRTEQRTHVIDIGCACILLEDDQFVEGHTTGWLQFYGERYRPMFPLTSETVCRFLLDFINCQEKPENWRIGAVVGWIDALSENSNETFKSVLAGEHVSVMQEGVG